MSLYRCWRINQSQRDSGSPGHLIHTAHLSLSQRITALYHMVSPASLGLESLRHTSDLTELISHTEDRFFFLPPTDLYLSASHINFNLHKPIYLTDLEQAKMCFVTTFVFICLLTTYQNKYMGVKQLGLGRG